MPTPIALCLSNDANEYQKAVRTDALSTAAKLGFELSTFTCDDRVPTQTRQLLDFIRVTPEKRPRVIIIMAARVSSLDRLAREAVESKIGWICINRRMDCVVELGAEFPTVPIGFVTPDQHETGRIQGRQFRALLPNGGKLLYVRGEATSSSAQGRLEGMQETIRGAKIEMAGMLDGNWSGSDSERVVSNFLRIVLSGPQRIDLIGCQSDEMAVGALKALKAVADYLKKPELAKTPVTGCDGLPDGGQELVNRGELTATVIMPSTGGPAVELAAKAVTNGVLPPAEVQLSPISFPPEK